jgi:hypothetical protein
MVHASLTVTGRGSSDESSERSMQSIMMEGLWQSRDHHLLGLSIHH